MRKEPDEHEANLQEILEIIFHIASEELDGLNYARANYEAGAEDVQRNRYAVVNEIMDESGYLGTFKKYRACIQKERKK